MRIIREDYERPIHEQGEDVQDFNTRLGKWERSVEFAINELMTDLREEMPRPGTPEYWAALRGDEDSPITRIQDDLSFLKKSANIREPIRFDEDKPPAPLYPERLDLTTVRAVSTGPAYFTRDDGLAMFYPGKVHDLHGASESGKSWVALAACVDVVSRGLRVAIIDFESDAATIIERLRLLGMSDDDIRTSVDYFSPDTSKPQTYDALFDCEYGAVVIDGVTVALASAGVASLNADDVAGWYRNVPHELAERTGAAVILVDHVTKAESTSRHAIGSVQKLNAITGASFLVKSGTFGRGTVGTIRLYLAKDRPGYLRGHCGPRVGDKLAEFGSVVIDASDPGRVRMTLSAPPKDIPTGDRLRENILTFVESNPEANSGTIKQGVTGKAMDIVAELDKLVGSGELVMTVRGKAKHYRLSTEEEFADTETADDE